jgi:iron complex outermembrane recepter protein
MPSKNAIGGSLHVLAVTAIFCGAPLARAADEGASNAPGDVGLPEILVTAEKVRSTVQDTPISVTAIDGDQLMAAGITTIEQVARDVPGLSMRSAGPGLTEYEARGLASNGGAAPTVGFYLDEIPLSPPALSQSGKVVIDPNLYDVDRVEVLRGPQGTLYGSGSMGGTVKIVTTAPKLQTWEGSAQAMLSSTDGGGTNYGASLAFNVPLGDKFALRVVASDLSRSGWIDEVVLNPFPINVATTSYGSLTSAPVQSVIHDANYAHISTERLTLLYRPNEDVSISVFFMNQRLGMGGYDLLDSTPTTSTSPGPIYTAHYEPFSMREPVTDSIQITGLTVNVDVGFADLTSATSYWDRNAVQTQDSSTSIYWTNAQAGGSYPPLVPIPYSEVDPSRQIAQELRLTSHDVGGLHWVGGAFYSGLRSVWQEESANAAVTSFGIPSGSYFTSYNPYDVHQTALFADGSYALADHWKIAAGMRWYTYHSAQHEQSWGYDAPFAVPSPPTLTTANDKGTNPRINISYEPTKTLNLYATAAKGFRPGGANQIIPPSNLPPHCTPGSLAFKPDSVWNYEIGEKAKFFDNRLTVNGDLYYIKWMGVQQVFTLVCGYQYYNNAGDGRSFGPELEVNAKLTKHLTLSASGTYTNSEITSPSAAYQQYLSAQVTEPNGSHPCPPAPASCTSPILNIPKETGSVVLSYSDEVMPDYLLTGRFDAQFVGTSTDVAYFYGMTLPSYSVENFRLMLEHGKWTGQFFVDNLANKVALVTANNTSFQFNFPQLVRYSTIQPRTIGVSFNYRF